MGDPVRSGAAIRQPLEQEEPSASGRGREIRPPCIELPATVVSRSTGGRGAFEPVLSCEPLRPASISSFCWRIKRHNTLAALADLCPQWLIRDLLPLPPNGGIPREATRSLSRPSSANAAGQRLRAGRCGA